MMKSCKIVLLLSGVFQNVYALSGNGLLEAVAQRQATNVTAASIEGAVRSTSTRTVTVLATAAPVSPAGCPAIIVTVTITAIVSAAAGASQAGLQTAGIIVSARPTGAGAAGVPQPAAVVAPLINSATLLLDGLLKGTTQAGATAINAGATSTGSQRGAVSSGTLKLAGIIASARPAGAGAMGVAQPPSAVAPAINSATLALDALINFSSGTIRSAGSTAIATGVLPSIIHSSVTSSGVAATVVRSSVTASGVAAITVGSSLAASEVAAITGSSSISTSIQSAVNGDGNSATLMTAGILLNSQAAGAATIGVPQPASPSGPVAAINSATLATAFIVGGTRVASGGSATLTGVSAAANVVAVGRVLQGGGLLGTLIAFLL